MSHASCELSRAFSPSPLSLERRYACPYTSRTQSCPMDPTPFSVPRKILDHAGPDQSQRPSPQSPAPSRKRKRPVPGLLLSLSPWHAPKITRTPNQRKKRVSLPAHSRFFARAFRERFLIIPLARRRLGSSSSPLVVQKPPYIYLLVQFFSHRKNHLLSCPNCRGSSIGRACGS